MDTLSAKDRNAKIVVFLWLCNPEASLFVLWTTISFSGSTLGPLEEPVLFSMTLLAGYLPFWITAYPDDFTFFFFFTNLHL